MDLSALLLACSMHADDRLLESIVFFHSRGNLYAVTDVAFATLDGELRAPWPSPSSLPEARATVARILASGGEPVVGVLPVRLEWATEFGKSSDELFDGCTNVALASAKLSEFDYQCRSLGPNIEARSRRAC